MVFNIIHGHIENHPERDVNSWARLMETNKEVQTNRETEQKQKIEDMDASDDIWMISISDVKVYKKYMQLVKDCKQLGVHVVGQTWFQENKIKFNTVNKVSIAQVAD